MKDWPFASAPCGSMLIVDDDQVLTIALSRYMRAAGFEVRVVHRGEAALEAIAHETPDVIVLDSALPDRDGFELCQTLRAAPGCETVKIVMISARARRVEREKGIALGADAFVTKPFSLRSLADVAMRLCGVDARADA